MKLKIEETKLNAFVHLRGYLLQAAVRGFKGREFWNPCLKQKKFWARRHQQIGPNGSQVWVAQTSKSEVCPSWYQNGMSVYQDLSKNTLPDWCNTDIWRLIKLLLLREKSVTECNWFNWAVWKLIIWSWSHLWPAFWHYRPERSKGRFNSKIRAANKSYAWKWALLLLSLIFVSLLQLNAMQCKKSWF